MIEKIKKFLENKMVQGCLWTVLVFAIVMIVCAESPRRNTSGAKTPATIAENRPSPGSVPATKPAAPNAVDATACAYAQGYEEQCMANMRSAAAFAEKKAAIESSSMSEPELLRKISEINEPMKLVLKPAEGLVVVTIKKTIAYVMVDPSSFSEIKRRAVENKNVDYSVEIPPKVEPSFLNGNLVMSLLPVLLLIGFMWWQQRKMMKGAQNPNNKPGMGASKAKKVESKVTFADVAGQDEAKQDLEEVVEFLKNPARFKGVGARIPRGVLMSGGPGLGKTLIARATAGEANVPFFTISGSDFVEMFVGVGASRVRDMFEQAKAVAPCIIFIDEIDAVGKARRSAGQSGGSDEQEQTLNQLLVEMDGFEENGIPIVLIAATNRPDVLDPALLRPGRFDRKVVVQSPDRDARGKLFTLYLKKIQLLNACSHTVLEKVDHWASVTPGMSGADIANSVNEAALRVARARKTDPRHMLDETDMMEGIQIAAMGRANESRSKIMTEEHKRSTSYHEGGHWIVSVESGEEPGRATIMPRGNSLGHYMPAVEETASMPYTKLMGRIAVCMAGRAAQGIYFNEQDGGCQQDLQMAHQLAKLMVRKWGMSKLGPISVGEEERIELTNPILAKQIHEEEMRFVNAGHDRACEIILKYKQEFAVASEVLMERETMHGLEMKEVWEKIKAGNFTPHVLSPKAKAKADELAAAAALPAFTNELPVPDKPTLVAALTSKVTSMPFWRRRKSVPQLASAA